MNGTTALLSLTKVPPLSPLGVQLEVNLEVLFPKTIVIQDPKTESYKLCLSPSDMVRPHQRQEKSYWWVEGGGGKKQKWGIVLRF